MFYKEDSRHRRFVRTEFTANTQRGSIWTPPTPRSLQPCFPVLLHWGSSTTGSSAGKSDVKVSSITGAFPSCRGCCHPLRASNQFPWEHGGCLTCSPCTGCSEGIGTVLQTACVAQPDCPLPTSSSERGVFNTVFHISCADKSLPGLT